jgi:hypothetical protein
MDPERARSLSRQKWVDFHHYTFANTRPELPPHEVNQQAVSRRCVVLRVADNGTGMDEATTALHPADPAIRPQDPEFVLRVALPSP